MNQSKDNLTALAKHLIEMQEKELDGIGRVLHDDTGQSLTVVKLMLEKAKKQSPETVVATLDEVIIIINEITKSISDLALELRPSILDDIGLIPALDWLFRRYELVHGLHIEFEHSESDNTFSPSVNTAIYRITKEAVTNVIKYSGNKEAVVKIHSDSWYVYLDVIDNRCGFDLKEIKVSGFGGINIMRERTKLLGGKFNIKSLIGRGTVLSVRLPLFK